MAYFANGSEGEYLDMQCMDCRIGIENYCPVAYAQGQYNYKQLKNEDLRFCLQILVSENGTCRMKQAIDAIE